MVGTIEERKQEIKCDVERIIRKNGTDSITIPMYDFYLLIDCLEQVCSEWSGATEVEELYCPLSDKYYPIWANEEDC